MKKMLKALSVALSLLAIGAVDGVAQSAVDPVGMYDFVATLGIEDRTGTLEIERNEAGVLVGEAWLEGEGDPALIESGVVNGNHVDLHAFVNGALMVTFALDFTDGNFDGTITAGDESIEVVGTRRAQ